MSRWRKLWGKAAAAVLTAVMLTQTTALAAPIDELNEIMEAQYEARTESLMAQTLGLSGLSEAADENGIQLLVNGGLTDGTKAMLSGDAAEWAGTTVRLNVQSNTRQRAWLFEAGAQKDGDDLLDLSLRGDSGRLSLMIPQLFEGALSLKAGNFKEQYLSSALAEILGTTEENAAAIPNLELRFYPEEDASGNLFEELTEQMQEKAEEFRQKTAVEKTEEDGLTVYTAAVQSDDIADLYEFFVRQYLSVFTESGLVSVADADFEETLETSLDQMMTQMRQMLGDEIELRFDVRDDLVERISYELYLDTAALKQQNGTTTEVVEGALAPAGNAADATGSMETSAPGGISADVAGETETSAPGGTAANAAEETETNAPGGIEVNAAGETEANAPGGIAAGETETNASGGVPMVAAEPDFQGYVDYEIAYLDPADVSEGLDCHITILDTERQELGDVLVRVQTQEDGTVSETTCSLEAATPEETVFSDTLFTMTFDAATGDFDAAFKLSAEGEDVALTLDSTFTEIEPGQSFLWKIDGLTVQSGTESVGYAGDISFSADPGEIAEPESERVLLEMTQGGWLDLVNEISGKAEAWTAQFAPQPSPEANIPELEETELSVG